jgi:ABC-type multidrug transport system ATPase subunit
MTVHDCMMFQAKLTNLDEYYDIHVDKIMEIMGISHARDSLIGGEIIRGISGGERRRTSIALEFLKNPNVLFLDEPTTGLDSTNADRVIEICSHLAYMGKTVVATLHSPSSQMFAKFDRLMLMADKKIVYNGSAEGSIDHFA